MASAKDIFIKPINARTANEIIKKIHYSGKVVQNSQLHFGVFLNNKLEGAMQMGCCIDKRKMLGIVKDTGWNEFIELNRMAFSDKLPKYSESRAIGICFRIIKKQYPQIKWVVSFSDSTQCGDGTIYRASGFVLTAIKKNTDLLKLSDGRIAHKLTFTNNRPTKIQREIRDKHHMPQSSVSSLMKAEGAKELHGHQLRYIYFIDKSYKEKLTVPILPFSEIDKRGAGMYKGESSTVQSRRVTKANSGDQLECGGAIPTNTLQSSDLSK